MPLYLYECYECSHQFAIQRNGDDRDKPAPCPACGVIDAFRIPSLTNGHRK